MTDIDDLRARGERLAATGEFARALEHLEEARSLAQTSGDQAALTGILGRVGEVYLEQGRLDEAVDVFKTALELAQANHDLPGQVTMHRRLGLVFREKGDLARARDAYRDAERRLDGLGTGPERDYERAQIQIGWAALYKEQGRYGKALEQLKSAEAIYEDLEDRVGAASALRRIAGVLHEQGEDDDAYEHIERARAMLELTPEDERNVPEQIEIMLLRGSVIAAAGRATEALECFRDALRLADSLKITPLRAESLRRMGSAYAARGDFAQAKERYQEAIDLSKRADDEVALSELYGDLGDVYCEQGFFHEAEQEYKRALALDNAHWDQLGMAVLHRRLGAVHQELGHLEQAESSYNEAARLLEDSDDSTEKAILALHVGSLLEERGHYHKALEQYARAEAEYRDQRSSVGVASCLRRIGSAKQQLGKLDEAAQALTNCLDLLDQQGGEDKPETILATNLLGSVLEDQGHSSKALAYYRDALQLADSLHLAPARAESLRRMGSAHTTRGEISQAVDRYCEAIEICKQHGDPVALSQLYGDLGDAHGVQGHLDAALDAYKEALRLDQRQEDDLGIAMSYRRLGSAHQRKGDHDRAEDYYRDANRMLESLEDDGERAVLFTSWGSLFEDQGGYRRAVEYYGKALDKNESQRHAIGTAICLRHLASSLLKLGEVSVARERAARAAQLLGDSGNENKLELIELDGVVALICLAEGRSDDARRHSKEALRLAEELQLGPARIRSLRVIGTVAAGTGNPSVGVERFRQALDLCKDLDDDVMRAELLDDLADALMEEGNVGEALETYSAGLKRARRLDRHALTADILLGLACCYREEGKLESARSVLDEAAEVIDQFDAPLNIKAQLTLQLAQLHEDDGRDDAALDTYEQALEELRRSNDHDGMLECHRLLLQAYARRRDHSRTAAHLSEVLHHENPGALWSSVLKRLHPDLATKCDSPIRDGRWASAATEAFKVFELRLRSISGDSGHTNANELVRDWFTPGRRGERPFEEKTLNSLAGFALGGMEICRTRHVHRDNEIPAGEAFAWIGVAHLLLEYLEEPSIVPAELA